MSAMQAVMSTQAPTAARSPERSNAARPGRARPTPPPPPDRRNAARPVRALTAAAIAPQSASTRAATVAPYPSSGITGLSPSLWSRSVGEARAAPWPLRACGPHCGRAPLEELALRRGLFGLVALILVPLRWRSSRGPGASSGVGPPSGGAVSAQALQQLLVPRLGAVVGRLVLLGVLGQDQR